MSASGDKRSLQGRLEVANPFELGQFLLLGNKTGALHLICQDQRGVLYFLNGQIVSAVGPDLKGGQDAAIEMLAWKVGDFQFLPEPVAPSEEIELRTENLLLEAARILDETGAGKEQIAAVLEQGDELSRTFAALTESHPDRAGRYSGTPADWLSDRAGRELVHVEGHPLRGRDLTGEWVDLSEETTPNPADIVDVDLAGPECGGWQQHQGRRFYLSWGTDGYRLVHPHGRPSLEKHLTDVEAITQQIAKASLVAVHGPSATGNTLLHILLTLLHTEMGEKVLYLSGVPTFDIGNGADCIHHVIEPGRDPGTVRRAIERWQPQRVAVDAPLMEETAGVVRDCWRSGTPVLIALGASDQDSATRQLHDVFGETHGGLLIRPAVTAPGPVLTLERPAA